MTNAVWKRTLRLLRVSARGQLMLLAIGVVALSLPALGGDRLGSSTIVRVAVEGCVALLLAALSMRLAVRGERGYDTEPSDLPGDVLALLPRLVAQLTLAIGPFAFALWGAMQLGGAVDLLGFLLVPLVGMIVTAFAPALAVFVTAAVASGDVGWTPRVALETARASKPAAFGVVWLLLAATTAFALPASLVALVFVVQVPHAGFVAFGLATSVAIPIIGCGGLALWREVGGVEQVLDAALAMPGGADLVQAPREAPGIEDAWVDGPAWDIAIDAGTTWGTWLRLATPTRAAIRVTWSGVGAPGLSLSGTDGVWWRPGDPPQSGAAVVVDLPAGDTYLQLESRSPAAQAMSIVLLLPAAAHSAA